MTTRYNEVRLVQCPGCSAQLDQKHWDDLSETYNEEEYHCDCGVSFTVRRADGLAVEVERM